MRRPVLVAAVLLSLSAARPASAWVSTYLEAVDVAVSLQPDGTAASALTARYVVLGGRLQDLRLLGVPGTSEFDAAASWVESDRGDRYGLELAGRRTADGVLRLRLAGGAFVSRGSATCHLALRDNLVLSGRLRADGDSPLVDWPPPIFPEGMGRMTVTVTLPGSGPAPTFRVEEPLVPVLEPVSSGRTLRLSKFRPAQLYAMPVRFAVSSAALPVASPAATGREPGGTSLDRIHRSTPPVVAGRTDPVSLLVVLPLLALALLAARAWRAERSAESCGGVTAPLLIPRLGAPIRWPLVVAALAAGTRLLIAGRVLAGLGLHALAVLLAIPDRFRWLDRASVGSGPWRALAAPSPRTWRSLAAATRRSRRSLLDPTGPSGLLLLLATIGGAGFAVATLLASDPASALVVAADAAMLLLPAFLAASERALPPVLPAESAVALERVRRRLLRRAAEDGIEIGYLLQDDDGGSAADVRLRVLRTKAVAARSAEVAVEWRVTAWGWCPTFAVLLPLPPGSRFRVGNARPPRGTEFRLAPDLGTEVWWFRASTPGGTARALLRTLRDVDAALAADAEASASGPPVDAGPEKAAA
jgi:hypothetical protein